MARQTLEDEFGDVIGKARRGQEMTLEHLSVQAGISVADLAAIERYTMIPSAEGVRYLANALGLDPARLQRSARNGFYPAAPGGSRHDELLVHMLNLGRSFNVNGYVVGCRQTGAGVVIDPGADADTILQAVQASGLTIEQILLTHGHHDHTGALADMCQATDAPAYVNQADLAEHEDLHNLAAADLIAGEHIMIGHQRLLVRHIPGHTAGSICLVHEQAAFVGDILFAGSLGGTRRRADYYRQIDGVIHHLFSLRDYVSLYPGHGPATTVGEEKANNPFFA